MRDRDSTDDHICIQIALWQFQSSITTKNFGEPDC